MIAEITALTIAALAGLGEWLHARRCRRLARLAFGPAAEPRSWTRAAPLLRIAACAALAWGLIVLIRLGPQMVQSDKTPEGGYRHLIVALDVSPSMKLEDSGPARNLARNLRAKEVMESVLSRVATDQIRLSVVAFYTDALPVAVDTYDLNVVNNILDDLPLELAFDVGKTSLFKGLEESFNLARGWQPGSATVIVVSDGDTVPDQGLPRMPRSIERVMFVGVGDAGSGKFIDGHQSRQDASTLRQLAKRLNGVYFNANQKHLPSEFLSVLAEVVPLREEQDRGRREMALVCVVLGALILSGLPLALAFAGSQWHDVRAGSGRIPPTKAPGAAAARQGRDQELTRTTRS